jgi:hypothetical protein
MTADSTPALTAEQWESRDYRQAARELDTWAKTAADAARAHDTTEYVAKIGLDESGSVIVMNRAHDRVLVPPPARAALAALALIEQPVGFAATDLDTLELARAAMQDDGLASALRDLIDRLRALLPPALQS